MARLSIGLLGTFQLTRTWARAAEIESDKGRALLAYLAVESAYSHRRKALTALLWPEADQERGNQNLRRALYNLRQAVEEPSAATALLRTSYADVQFDASGDYWLDVNAFSDLVNSTADHRHRRLDACNVCCERLAAAAALYRGDFLAGLALADCNELEDWRMLKQEELRGLLMHALLTLATYHERLREYERAAGWLRRLIDLEPWREEVQRQLMRVLALDGQRSAALQQFDSCCRVMLEELGVGPAAETVELYRLISAGQVRPVLTSDESPYKGLAEFSEADAGSFFGRESLVDNLLERLSRSRQIVVIGTSGAGKSSFIRAGVLPRLSGEQSGQRWLVATFRPGSQPFMALAEALVPLLAPGSGGHNVAAETGALASDLASGEASLRQLTAQIVAAARRQAGSAAPPRLLLVADQFEECFTLCADAGLRRAFLDLLLAEPEGAAEDGPPPLTLLLSMRADFTVQSLSYRPLADAIQRGGLIVGPMTRDELRRAIVEPARRRGLVFEPGLVERLLDDVADEPGNLPLLEFALTLLWARRHDNSLTHDAYEEISGVAGALTSYAEQVFARLASAEQEAARRVFMQLVQPGDGTADTRRMAGRADLGEANWRIVQQLAGARLLVTGADALGHEGAELVHEALIANWTRLKGWMADNRALRLWEQRLRGGDLAQWERSGRDAGWLLRGVALAEASGWLESHRDEISPRAVAFVEASAAQQNSERAVEERRRERELAQARALAEAERRRADVEAAARQEQGLLSMLALSAAQQARSEQLRASRAAEVAQSFNLTTNARLALNERNTDLALALAVEANKIAEPPPAARRILAQAAYAPGTRRLLDRHSGPLYGLALSSDGRIAVSGSSDMSLIVWDMATGQEVRRLVGHEDTVEGAAVSPDGCTVLSASADRTLLLWDTGSGAPIRRFSGHTAGVRAVAFSPDGQTAISASRDGTLIRWDVGSGQPLQHLRGHEAAVYCVAISPDGGRAISGSADHSVIVWDLASGAIETRFKGMDTTMSGAAGLFGHWNSVWGVAFSDDGTRAVSVGDDECVVLWDIAGAKLVTQFRAGSQLYSLALLPNDQVLVGTLDNRILRFDLSHEFDTRYNPRLDLELLGHSGRVYALAVAPDGRTLVSASADGTARVWDLLNGAEIRRASEHPVVAATVAVSPDQRFGVTGHWDGLLTLWDYQSGADLRELEGHSEMVFAGAYFTPDSRQLVSASGDIYGTSTDHTVRLWDVESGQEIRRFSGHTDKIWSLALSPDGRFSASGSADGTVQLWEIATGASRALCDLSPQLPRTLSFSPDGKMLLIGPSKGASSRPDFSLRLLDVASGQEVRRFVGHGEIPASVVFSPDGSLIASAAHDKRVIIWDAASATPLHSLSGQTSSLNSVAFSPDGALLVGGDQGGTVYLWAVGSGELLRLYHGHTRVIVKTIFAPDGQTIFSGADDDTVREWRIHATHSALARWIADNRYLRELTDAERTQYGIS